MNISVERPEGYEEKFPEGTPGFRCNKCGYRQFFEGSDGKGVRKCIADKTYSCACSFRDRDHVYIESTKKGGKKVSEARAVEVVDVVHNEHPGNPGSRTKRTFPVGTSGFMCKACGYLQYLTCQDDERVRQRIEEDTYCCFCDDKEDHRHVPIKLGPDGPDLNRPMGSETQEEQEEESAACVHAVLCTDEEKCESCGKCRGCCGCGRCQACKELIPEEESACDNCDCCSDCCECCYCESCGTNVHRDDYCGDCDSCDDCCPCKYCDGCGSNITEAGQEDGEWCFECDQCRECCECSRCDECGEVCTDTCDTCGCCDSCCGCQKCDCGRVVKKTDLDDEWCGSCGTCSDCCEMNPDDDAEDEAKVEKRDGVAFDPWA